MSSFVVISPRALEFACHSAACAPPSAGGTGGSNPGDGGSNGKSSGSGSPSVSFKGSSVSVGGVRAGTIVSKKSGTGAHEYAVKMHAKYGGDVVRGRTKAEVGAKMSEVMGKPKVSAQAAPAAAVVSGKGTPESRVASLKVGSQVTVKGDDGVAVGVIRRVSRGSYEMKATGSGVFDPYFRNAGSTPAEAMKRLSYLSKSEKVGGAYRTRVADRTPEQVALIKADRLARKG